MADPDEIRRIVREELASNFSPRRVSSGDIYARTQDVISNAISSINTNSTGSSAPPENSSNNNCNFHWSMLGSKNSTMVLPSSSVNSRASQSSTHSSSIRSSSSNHAHLAGTGITQSPQFLTPTTKRKSSNPSHPWRYNPRGKSKKEKPAVEKSIYIYLLNCTDNDDERGSDTLFTETDVLVKGFVSLSSNDEETFIKSKINSLFVTEYPSITENHFVYVKRDRQRVFKPSVPTGWKWDFPNLKALWGQGKLYCRLTKPLDTENEMENDLFDDQVLERSYLKKPNNTTVNEVINVDSPSSGIQDLDPTSSSSRVEELTSLVHEILEENSSNNSKSAVFDNFEKVKAYFKTKVVKEKIKIRVDPGYFLESAFEYLKDPEFDPANKLSISYKKQPGVDTGGITRQFFTDVFHQLLSGTSSCPQVFEGNSRRLLPIHNVGVVMSGVLELTGKLMALSLAHSFVGVQCIAPCIYDYICFGEISSAMTKVSLEDLPDESISSYLQTIADTELEDDFRKISEEEEFQQLYFATGMTCLLCNSTKAAIIQGIVFQEVLGKRLTALEQIRKGLELLGVKEVLRNNSELLKPLFIYTDGLITSSKVLEKVDIQFNELNDRQRTVRDWFQYYLSQATEEKLLHFVVFCTGSKFLPSFHHIKVKFVNEIEGFVSSTCLLKLEIPTFFNSKADFDSSFDSVLTSGFQSFSAV